MADPTPASGSTLILSSNISPLLSSAELCRIAGAAGYRGLDLHPSRWPRAIVGSRLPTTATIAPRRSRVAALWLPVSARSITAGAPGLTPERIDAIPAIRPERLVLEIPPAVLGDHPRAGIAGLVESVRRDLASPLPITVALGVRALVGGRSHLAELSLLRRLAGEWDFDLALDLTGKLDPRWEAEAAIVRLGSRLRLVHLGGSAVVGRWSPESRLLDRALNAVLQRPEPVVVSLQPPLRAWRQASPAAVERAAWVARISVGRRIEKYREQWAISAWADRTDRPVWHPERP